MKRNHIDIKHLIVILLSTFCLVACSDWLSIVPENDLIKEKFWTKSEDVDAALASTYDAFRDCGVESFIWGELRADLIRFSSVGELGNYVKISASSISQSNPKINWSKYYQTINYANTLMYYGNDVLKMDDSFTEEMKNSIDAEALFLRAFSYYYLVRIWKEVPLVTEPSVSDTGNIFLNKSKEHVIINQIINDLNEAKDKIGPLKFQDNPAYLKGRANKYSIMALLADVYLWNEQYQKSADYCDSIINSGLFGLELEATWFNLYNPGNSMIESIFEIQFDDRIEDQENPIYIDRDNIPSLIPVNGTLKITFNDPVLSTILDKEEMRYCKGNNPAWKYLGVTYNGKNKRLDQERDANFIYYRYSDILLTKADALTELNRIGEANQFLRPVVVRGGKSYIDYVYQADLRDAILKERAREFVCEGKRWFDLLRVAKRNKFENRQLLINSILSGADVRQQAILRTRVGDTMGYYLPIPENDILYNPNLEQNPFYDR
jgi:hypothetical protein